MKLADIPRVRAGCNAGVQDRNYDELQKERLALGTRAADLLGYRGLVRDVTGESTLVKPGELAATLNSLGIETLDIGAVLTYQMEEAGRWTRQKIEEGNLDDWTHGYFSPATWQKQSFADYTKDIPEFAVDLAIRIKEANGDVKFSIQYLSEPKADPFLIAYIDKEIYYVAAWDEPGFEGRAPRRK
jgi:hypothetical protein